MPKHSENEQFRREWAALSQAEQDRFIVAMKKMVADLKAGRSYRSGLRIKRVQSRQDVWEMSWASNGRATFTTAPDPETGDTHITWRRIGGHEILSNP